MQQNSCSVFSAHSFGFSNDYYFLKIEEEVISKSQSIHVGIVSTVSYLNSLTSLLIYFSFRNKIRPKYK